MISWLCACVGLAPWVYVDHGVWLFVTGHAPFISNLHKWLDIFLHVTAAHISRLQLNRDLCLGTYGRRRSYRLQPGRVKLSTSSPAFFGSGLKSGHGIHASST